jgi:uncharacterized membrane protein YjjB (DUF3815 family)
MLAWPAAIGLLAHTLRWVALSKFHSSAATAALVACLFAGLVVTPVARRWHLPFAAIGFASVVSMIPGSYLMRMAGGLVQIADGSRTTLALISGTVTDGATSITVTFAIAVGLIVPKLVIDRLAAQPWQRPRLSSRDARTSREEHRQSHRSTGGGRVVQQSGRNRRRIGATREGSS